MLQSIESAEIVKLIDRALNDTDLGLGKLNLIMSEQDQQQLAEFADGDARRALTLLELCADLCENNIISHELLMNVVGGSALRRFDKGGEAFYDQISALHKSVRGSSPDAALYWLCRMLDSGCDPLYLSLIHI